MMTDSQPAPADSLAWSLYGLHEELFHVRSLQLTKRSMRANHKQRCSWEDEL